MKFFIDSHYRIQSENFENSHLTETIDPAEGLIPI